MADFQRDLMFLLHDVARLMRVDADKRARAHGMTRAQWGILIWLERQPGLSQKELSEILEVEPITVARLIDRLEARGMVERRPDPKDRRIWRLHLCAPAYGVLGEIDRQRTQMRAAGDRRPRRRNNRNDDGSAPDDEDDVDPRGPQSPPLRPHRNRSAGGCVMSQATATAGAAPRVTEAPVRNRRMSRALLRPILMLGGILVVAVGSGAYWLTGGRYVSIDDAYVRAAKETLSTDVSGIVPQVPVREGQHVKKGDVLLRLDPSQFQIMLASAKAMLGSKVLDLNAEKLNHQRMLRDVEVKQAQVQADQANFDRLSNLVKSGGVTRADFDNMRYQLAANQQAVVALKTQAAMQLAKLGGDPDVDVHTMPDYLQAQARVDEAQRQLDHSVIYAPFDGVVTQVDTVQPGMYLAASTAAFGIVSTDGCLGRGQPEGNRAHLGEAGRSGQCVGRYLSGPNLEGCGREHRAQLRLRVLRAAGAEHVRQLGEGGAAHPGPHPCRAQAG